MPDDAVRRRGLAVVRRVLCTGRVVYFHGDGLQLRVDPVTRSFVSSFTEPTPLPLIIIDGLAAGKLKPVIAKTFPLDQIVADHRYLESNQQIGKMVVTV